MTNTIALINRACAEPCSSLGKFLNQNSLFELDLEKVLFTPGPKIGATRCRSIKATVTMRPALPVSCRVDGSRRFASKVSTVRF